MIVAIKPPDLIQTFFINCLNFQILGAAVYEKFAKRTLGLLIRTSLPISQTTHHSEISQF